eukprot:CAMPEP_0174721852 /NCGR_PEP_ID=MMETSP1094-20130205/37336_1 /TAXON_ID=156173 /ORGANISM="Chrysochromulina brevifilum, Strain UTEX LB 985" /LENGTH=32 /DNA_ID= /DNA_START= /DNA_END= /DNA_ORIENTATION=
MIAAAAPGSGRSLASQAVALTLALSRVFLALA